MGICSECKHAVFGAIGNYCAVDKHGIKADDRCTIGEFIKYEPPKPVLTSPPCADKCSKKSCAGCDDDEEAYTMSGWWSPGSNLTQLKFIFSGVCNADYSGSIVNHSKLLNFVNIFCKYGTVSIPRIAKSEIEVLEFKGGVYLRYISSGIASYGSGICFSSSNFSSRQAAHAAKNFIDLLIDEYDARTSIKFNRNRYYYIPQTMPLTATLEKTSFDDFSKAILESVAESYGIPADWLKSSFELMDWNPERYKK